MKKCIGLMLLVIGAQSFALASIPEIDPGSAGSALAMVAGALLIIKGRRKR